MSNPTPNPNGNGSKDVIYVDIDDEITAIIDKVRDSEARIVALVLPKRATAMQSIVNMKLLKRSAESAKKHIVLITSETGLLPLAGGVGLYVAKNLQSRPEIPVIPGAGRPTEDEEDAVDMAALPDAKLDRTKPVGAYAGAAAADGSTAKTAADGAEETIELDNSKAAGPTAGIGAAAAKVLGKKDKKLKIPDFNKFRLWLIGGGAALVLLIFLGYLAFNVMPKATVTVKTDSSAVETNIDIALDPEATEVDTEDFVLPATEQKTVKTSSQSVDATGSLNKGEKATGTVTVTNCSFSPVTLPAGTGFSANNMTFISQKAVTVPISSYTPTSGGFKCNNNGKESVDVAAQKSGAGYNLTSREYTVANTPENVKATGGDMTGGTDVVVKIVQQADIDAAKQKIAAADAEAIELELEQTLDRAKLYPINDTFAPAPNPEVSPSVPVGTEAESVTVTQKTTYTMLGVKESDLKDIIAHEVNQKIDTKRQQILDYGLADAFFKVQNQEGRNVVVTMEATSVAGSDLNLTDIKKQIAGKKTGDVKEIIEAYPGVTEVNVKYSPFWVSSVPKKTGKITLDVEKPTVENNARD